MKTLLILNIVVLVVVALLLTIGLTNYLRIDKALFDAKTELDKIKRKEDIIESK